MSDDPMEHPALLFASSRIIAAHQKLGDTPEADGLLEVLDQLAGWCVPRMRLAPSPDVAPADTQAAEPLPDSKSDNSSRAHTPPVEPTS